MTRSRSRSLKVTNFDINRKPVCDFNVNNIKVGLRPISYRFLSRSICQIIAFDKGIPLVNILVLRFASVIYCHKLD